MNSDRDRLVSEVADLIISSVNLRNRKKEDISEHTPLMQDGLALDSLDILEIVVSLEQKYKVKITGPEMGLTVFQTVGTIADFVQSHSK